MIGNEKLKDLTGFGAEEVRLEPRKRNLAGAASLSKKGFLHSRAWAFSADLNVYSEPEDRTSIDSLLTVRSSSLGSIDQQWC